MIKSGRDFLCVVLSLKAKKNLPPGERWQINKIILDPLIYH